MRSEHEMLDLIVKTAADDERVRAVIMNGSRTNLNVPRDIFQDFDIVFVVTDPAFFMNDAHWIDRFAARMMMQLPDAMDHPLRRDDGRFAYLMQFADGNRLDLTIVAVDHVHEVGKDSQSILLLDKDQIIGPLAPPSDDDYLPSPPTAKAFADCCNEFWWVCLYVAKGLWRREIIYAKHCLDDPVRDQLMKMITWYVGVKVQFSRTPGKFGRYLNQYLEPDLWGALLKTYSDAGLDNTWDAMDAACDLFRRTAVPVAEHFGYDYPDKDDRSVCAHLRHVRLLPENASMLY